MNLFVTGGTGFIGSNFLEKAMENGHKIVGLRRRGSQTRIPLSTQPNWVEGTLEDNFTEDLKDIDILVHFASHSPNVPYDSLENCIYWNVVATLKLFDAALEAGIDKFLVAGSSFEYGTSANLFDKIPPSAPLTPIENYPVSKAMASIMLNGWAVKNKVKLKILRIFNVYGEGETDTRLWPSLKKEALAGNDFKMTKGEQVRDFINVKDLAKIFLDELDFSKINKGACEIKNVGSGKSQTVLQFSKYWWKKWKAKGELLEGILPYRENEVMQYLPKI
jgi:nucleoside-diphosphate-sugar epimerase